MLTNCSLYEPPSRFHRYAGPGFGIPLCHDGVPPAAGLPESRRQGRGRWPSRMGSPTGNKSTMPKFVPYLSRDSAIAKLCMRFTLEGDSQPHRGTDRVGHEAGLQLHKIGRGAPGHSSPDGLWALASPGEPGATTQVFGGQPRAARAKGSCEDEML